jgi:hypothetical protein
LGRMEVALVSRSSSGRGMWCPRALA